MEVFLIKALQLIASLSLLVILHEGGHFFFAKLFHTRVEKFSLFFGYKFDIFSTYSKWFRKLIGKQPAKVKYIKDKDGNDVPDGYEYEGTEYAIGWIPLGGYVKISGMIDESMDTEQMKQPAKPWEFRSKPAYQRLLIMVGGVLVNFLLALFIYSMILFAWGESYVSPKDMTLGMTFNEQAKNLGFKDGDKVIGADDEVFEKFNGSMLRSVSNAKTVKILRQDKEMKINMPEEGVSLLDMLKSTRPFMMVSIPTVVREVINDTPASEAGINVGDTLLAINGTSLKTWTDYNVYIAELGEGLKDAPTYDSIQARHVSIVLKRAKTNVVDTINVFLNSELKMGIMQDSANSFYTPTEVNYSF
ncbi:MAG: site-2 protease family protein, partial [Prevotellaceae bacterium]|nr:site-2 protease family protein [Candidatus Faecinaster equi]